MIPAAELTAMQAIIEASFDTNVAVTRPPAVGTGTDGYGHPAGAGNYAPVAQTVTPLMALFDRPSGPVLAEIVAKIGALVVWVVSLPAATNIKSGDRLSVVATGETFQVHTLQVPESYSPFITAIVGEVR